MLRFLLVVLAITGLAQSQPPAPDATCYQTTGVSAKQCCKMPKPIDSTTMEKCRAEFPRSGQRTAVGVAQTEGDCVVQCVMTANGGFVNNALNADGIKKSLASTLVADVNFGPLVSGAVDTCVRQIQNDPAYTVTPVTSSTSRAACSFLPQGFVNCLHTALFKSCPAAVWTESTDCQALKTKLNSGCPLHLLMGRGRRH